MINNDMDSKLEQIPEQPARKTDESGAIYVRGFVKITDPDTGEVVVETGN